MVEDMTMLHFMLAGQLDEDTSSRESGRKRQPMATDYENYRWIRDTSNCAATSSDLLAFGRSRRTRTRRNAVDFKGNFSAAPTF
jgi:hypothetical protein